jgi:hypothetical protein
VKYPPYPIKLISIYACRSIASTDIPDLFLLTNTIYLTQTLHTSTWPTHYQLCRSSSLLFSVRTPVFKVPDLVWSSTHILYSSTIRSLPPGRLRTRSRHQHLPDNSWVLALFSRIRLYRNILLTISTHRYFPGHVHAFYLIYVYYNRNEKIRQGGLTGKRARGIYSDEIQKGLSAVYDADDAGWRKSAISNKEAMVSASNPGIEPQLVDSKNDRAAQWTRVMKRSNHEEC